MVDLTPEKIKELTFQVVKKETLDLDKRIDELERVVGRLITLE